VYYQGSLVGLCSQDYKSLCAVVTICATLVDIQTHQHIGGSFSLMQLTEQMLEPGCHQEGKSPD